MSTQLQNALARNRTEELGADVWANFVIPPFFDRLTLGSTMKPKVIVGGRGCGKTMLLRYLSHQSTFSPNRKLIPDNATAHLGLYWRADTQFANLMAQRGIEDDIWSSAFRHLAALILGLEVLSCLESIGKSRSQLIHTAEIERLSFAKLTAFDSALPSNFRELQDDLQRRVWEFDAWVNDVRTLPRPRFLPGDKFVNAQIKIIRDALPKLKDAVFFVYLDEYENLESSQKRIVNTWLKHSQPPLIFNLAVKRNAFTYRDTVGPERLSDIHDFRIIDIETYDLDSEFPVFAAEILFLQLQLAGCADFPIQPEVLRDTRSLSVRREVDYYRPILETAHTLLPDTSQLDLARGVFDDPTLSERLRKNVEDALRKRSASQPVASFVLENQPEASIVVPALLNRQNVSPEEVLTELDKLKAGKPSRFDDWIHNNCIACILQLYHTLSRPCPFYGGFHTFCHLSRGNIRHFLELCHQSLQRATTSGIGLTTTIQPQSQAEAARQVSADFLGEVRSFGPQGNYLHAFVLRLGSLFALSQQRPPQSEPERTHFSVQRGRAPLNEADFEFLGEAVKWSVLFEEKETKKKASVEPEVVQYVLNPIYAPYFRISYRKRRRLELSSDQAHTLIQGSLSEVTRLFQDFSKQWNVDPSESNLPLFPHLEAETSSV